MAAYKLLLAFIIKSFRAGPRSSQMRYTVVPGSPYCTIQRGRKAVPRCKNVPNAPSGALSTAVARPVSVQYLVSQKASTLDTEPSPATLVRSVASYGDRRDIHDLLKLRSYGRAKAVYSYVASRTHQFSVVRRREMRESNVHNTFRASIGDLSIFCNGRRLGKCYHLT